MYKAVINEDISLEKPRCSWRIGIITIIPPPGTPATENFAQTKYIENIRYEYIEGSAYPKLFKIANAKIGIAKQSPTKWTFDVTGIIAFTRSGFFEFFDAPSIVRGIVAALDIVVKPLMVAGNMDFKESIKLLKLNLAETK